jgi:hypothetical protein
MIKRLALVSTLLALAAAPALAAGFGQGVSDKPGRQLTDKQKEEARERQQRREEAERGYNQTIKSLPDSKEKFDPWKGSR